jgi:hypothetical protein
MSLVTELISSVLQLLVFAFLPFIVHLAGSKTAKGFLRDLGFHRAERRTWRLMWIALAAIFAIHPIHYLIPGVPEVMNSEASLNGKVRAAGFSFEMVLVVIVVSWIKTALAEEILFRGFLAKRLIRRWGFVAGNTVQAAVFGRSRRAPDVVIGASDSLAGACGGRPLPGSGGLSARVDQGKAGERQHPSGLCCARSRKQRHAAHGHVRMGLTLRFAARTLRCTMYKRMEIRLFSAFFHIGRGFSAADGSD